MEVKSVNVVFVVFGFKIGFEILLLKESLSRSLEILDFLLVSFVRKLLSLVVSRDDCCLFFPFTVEIAV